MKGMYFTNHWIGGDRMHCFGLDAGEVTFNQVEVIVEANLMNYKQLYATLYMDH